MKKNHDAFIITCKADNTNTIALIDTNFISYKFLQDLIEYGMNQQIKPANITLKLANQQTINAMGSIDIIKNFETKDISVRMFIVKELAYPIISGCEFLRKEEVRFDNGQDEILSTNIMQEANLQYPQKYK
jgi:hypothetical protein